MSMPNPTDSPGGSNEKPKNDETKSSGNSPAVQASDPGNLPKQDPGKENIRADGQMNGATSESKNTGLWPSWLSRPAAEPDKPSNNTDGMGKSQKTGVEAQAPSIEATLPEPQVREEPQSGTQPDEKPKPPKRSWLQMFGSDSTQSGQNTSSSL